MLLLGEQDFAASNHDSFDANSLVMVTLRQATSWTQLWTQVSMNDIFAVSSRDPWEAYRRAYEIC
jgi:hypothetical protein